MCVSRPSAAAVALDITGQFIGFLRVNCFDLNIYHNMYLLNLFTVYISESSKRHIHNFPCID